MRRILLFILSIVLCMSIISCGNDSAPSGDGKDTGEESHSSDINEKLDFPEDLPGVVSVNLESVQYCINAPNEQIFSYGNNYVNMNDYIVIYDQYDELGSTSLYDVDVNKITKPSEVIEGMRKQFISACSFRMERASDYDFDIEYEDVKVNEWDMSKFTGVFHLIYEVENPQVDYTSATFAGYSVIKDGCPVYFVVIDIPSEGGVDNVEEVADKIAKTFREYSED